MTLCCVRGAFEEAREDEEGREEEAATLLLCLSFRVAEDDAKPAGAEEVEEVEEEEEGEEEDDFAPAAPGTPAPPAAGAAVGRWSSTMISTSKKPSLTTKRRWASFFPAIHRGS